MPDNEKRLGVDIPEPLWFELNDLIHWGHKKHIYTTLTRQLVELLQKADDPSIIIAMIMDNEITAQNLLERAQRQADEAKRSQDVDPQHGGTRGAEPGAGAEGGSERGLPAEG